MSEPLSLLEFVQRLAGDGDLRGDFAADPHGVLADHGLDGLPPEDVRDALLLVEDTRTLDYQPDHDPGPLFDPDGPDALVRYLADHAGLDVGHAGFDVDGSGDIDDLDGYAVTAPQHAAPVDDPGHGAPEFGYGVHVPSTVGADLGPDLGPTHPEPDAHPDLHGATEAVFDEPGSYDEFGTDPAFDHPHGFDHPVDEPGHPG
ncbi:hypothetical protein ACQEVB_06540 [Pseudonocardia sp. CA-107938]|uniref:hypothetical protein n=1 Tax=Pseudonocardia sp. CA-107938 TaxID=3240021 RepID=UPI003D8B4982